MSLDPWELTSAALGAIAVGELICPALGGLLAVNLGWSEERAARAVNLSAIAGMCLGWVLGALAYRAAVGAL